MLELVKIKIENFKKTSFLEVKINKNTNHSSPDIFEVIALFYCFEENPKFEDYRSDDQNSNIKLSYYLKFDGEPKYNFIKHISLKKGNNKFQVIYDIEFSKLPKCTYINIDTDEIVFLDDPNNYLAPINTITEDNFKDYQKKIEKSISEVEKTIPVYSAEVYFYRGNTKNNLKQFHEAILDFDKAIEINPNYSETYNNRGTAKDKLKQFHEAILDFDKAIKLNPNNAEAYNNRGIKKNNLKQFHEAILDFDKAIKLNPNNAKTYYTRGIAYKNLGQVNEAQENFKKANEIDPNVFFEEGSKELKTEVEETKEIAKKAGESAKKAQEFQKVLGYALEEYKKDAAIWLITASTFSPLSFVILVVLHLLPYFDKDILQLKDSLTLFPISIFLVTLNFIVIRQYTNAKKLSIETNNRLIASKLFEKVKQEEKDTDIKKIAYPKLIESIVDSPYSNQKIESMPNSVIEKIMAILGKK